MHWSLACFSLCSLWNSRILIRKVTSLCLKERRRLDGSRALKIIECSTAEWRTSFLNTWWIACHMLIMSNQCLQTLPSQQLRSFQMIFQWISCLINAAAGWYWHSNQHQTGEQMLSVLTWYMLNQNLSWDNYTYINTNASYTRSI